MCEPRAVCPEFEQLAASVFTYARGVSLHFAHGCLDGCYLVRGRNLKHGSQERQTHVRRLRSTLETGCMCACVSPSVGRNNRGANAQRQERSHHHPSRQCIRFSSPSHRVQHHITRAERSRWLSDKRKTRAAPGSTRQRKPPNFRRTPNLRFYLHERRAK